MTEPSGPRINGESLLPQSELNRLAFAAHAKRRDVAAMLADFQVTVAEVLDMPDRPIREARVKWLIQSTPGVGVRAARAIYAAARGLTGEIRLRAIRSQQRQHLLNHPFIQRHTAAVIRQRQEGTQQ